jgi:hypothetical protein
MSCQICDALLAEYQRRVSLRIAVENGSGAEDRSAQSLQRKRGREVRSDHLG